jgi:hypothetical protein
LELRRFDFENMEIIGLLLLLLIVEMIKKKGV